MVSLDKAESLTMRAESRRLKFNDPVGCALLTSKQNGYKKRPFGVSTSAWDVW